MNSVDVIVPCYRYGHYLRECVASILSQEGVEVRVLVIDDCSPDNTAEVGAALSREDSRVTFVRHSVNQKHIATYNEGIEWISAKYYMLLSADDYLLPGALGRTAAFMDAHPGVGLAFGQAATLYEGESLPEEALQGGRTDWELVAGVKFIERSGARNLVPTPTAVVRTEVQKRVGGYRPELPHTGDMELWLRLAAHSDVGICEAFHAVYRRHEANMSLGYTTRSWLPDLRQRKAALDAFDASCRGLLPDARQLRRSALRMLAGEALWYSNSAFRDGEEKTCDELARFAVELSPGIRFTRRWAKLACKRLVGQETWQSLRSPIARVRELVNPN